MGCSIPSAGSISKLMPGLVGIISPEQPSELNRSLQHMMGLLRHESFYSSAHEACPDINAYVGVVNASESASRVVWNVSRDIGCVLFGEPLLETSPSASSADSVDSTSSPAAALLALYEEVGTNAIAHLNGCFCGVVLDLRRRHLVLFNDRYGLNRVYIHQSTNRILFASEAKAILALVPETRNIDVRGLAEWWSCGCVLQNRTLFREISLLPPASAWLISSNGEVDRQKYFEPQSWQSLPALTTDAYLERLIESFPRALHRSFNGPDRVAMSLTGGLDGRMIMAWARSAPGELPCYTFNGPYRDCADVRIARRVANACGQRHEGIQIGTDFFSNFPQLAEKTVYITDGAMDVIGAAELYVNRLARQIAPVRMTGNYGSEIVRRHVAFKTRRMISHPFTGGMREQFDSAERTYAHESKGNRLAFIAFKQVPWHHFARYALERSQINVRSPFLDNDLVSLAFQAPPEAAQALEPTLRVIAAGNPRLARIPTDRGLTWPPPSRTFNRLRHRFHDLVAKAEYAYDYGMPDWLARADRSISRLQLERLFLGRQKFCHFRTWYRHQLAPYVKNVLLDPISLSRAYLNRAAIEPLVNGHVCGTRNCTTEIHKLLSLELLHRQLLD